MSSNKVDAFDMPLRKTFVVMLEDIVWCQTLSDEWLPKRCTVAVEADRSSQADDIIGAAKTEAGKKYGTGVLFASSIIHRDGPDPEDTLEYDGEVY